MDWLKYAAAATANPSALLTYMALKGRNPPSFAQLPQEIREETLLGVVASFKHYEDLSQLAGSVGLNSRKQHNAQMATAMEWIAESIRQEMDPDAGTAWCEECDEAMCHAYMVDDAIWKAVTPPLEVPPDARNLHLWCLEKRLRRRLAPSDFPDLPINQTVFFLLRRS